MHRLGMWSAALGLAALALAWNASHFFGTTPKPRSKALDFLPPPVVAQALSLGQPTALAKLRWIDSFAYFQLQVERLDDRVAGDGRGGFERLYDTLISLDPHFLPFYEHAVLNTSGVLKQKRVALAFLMRGLLAEPHQTSLWRLASAELAISFELAKRDPAKLDQWLRSWEQAETDEFGRQAVRDWRRGLAFTAVDGLDTLPYWLDQLRTTKPGTPLADFVENTIRELLAEHGVRELAHLAGQAEAAPDHDLPRRLLAGRLLPWQPIGLDPVAVVRRYPKGPPPWAPVVWTSSAGPQLRPDPFGYPWRYAVDRIISPGREQRRFLTLTQGLRVALEGESDKRGRPPRDLAEAEAWGFALPAPPDQGRWNLDERLPKVVWPTPPQQPWPLR